MQLEESSLPFAEEWSPIISGLSRNRVHVLCQLGELLDAGYLTNQQVSECFRAIFNQNTNVGIYEDLLASRNTMLGKAQFIKLYMEFSTETTHALELSPPLLVPRPHAPNLSAIVEPKDSPESMKSTHDGSNDASAIYPTQMCTPRGNCTTRQYSNENV